MKCGAPSIETFETLKLSLLQSDCGVIKSYENVKIEKQKNVKKEAKSRIDSIDDLGNTYYVDAVLRFLYQMDEIKNMSKPLEDNKFKTAIFNIRKKYKESFRTIDITQELNLIYDEIVGTENAQDVFSIIWENFFRKFKEVFPEIDYKEVFMRSNLYDVLTNETKYTIVSALPCSLKYDDLSGFFNPVVGKMKYTLKTVLVTDSKNDKDHWWIYNLSTDFKWHYCDGDTVAVANEGPFIDIKNNVGTGYKLFYERQQNINPPRKLSLPFSEKDIDIFQQGLKDITVKKEFYERQEEAKRLRRLSFPFPQSVVELFKYMLKDASEKKVSSGTATDESGTGPVKSLSVFRRVSSEYVEVITKTLGKDPYKGEIRSEDIEIRGDDRPRNTYENL